MNPVKKMLGKHKSIKCPECNSGRIVSADTLVNPKYRFSEYVCQKCGTEFEE